MKIYVSVDMEGIMGVTRAVQVQPGTPEYAVAREWAVGEVCAYLEGAKAEGATEFWVKDAHGSGFNLPWDAFSLDTHLVAGNTGEVRFPGLDSSFAALFLVGYHAMAGTPNAVLEHTWSSASKTRFFLNHKVVGEIALDATIAGVYGVPVALVSGDDKTALEAQAELGTVESVIVKEGLTREGAILYSQQVALRHAREGARRAIHRLKAGEFAPYCPQSPRHFRMTWTNAQGVQEMGEAQGEDLRATIRQVLGQA